MDTKKNIEPSRKTLSSPSASTPASPRAAARASAGASWMRVDDAARILGMNVITLRRSIERHARRDTDGRVHAEFDGIRARKLGRLWRVLLDPCWSARASA